MTQTSNDMLADNDSDELALVEGLSGYYYKNSQGFGGLNIKSENMDRFNTIEDWVIECCNGV